MVLDRAIQEQLHALRALHSLHHLQDSGTLPYAVDIMMTAHPRTRPLDFAGRCHPRGAGVRHHWGEGARN